MALLDGSLADVGQDDMLPPIRAGAGGQTAGPGGPKISAPTDVPNFGRINPKSCKSGRRLGKGFSLT